jgi:threonine/homoserine/homoserine lactone efflux protein
MSPSPGCANAIVTQGRLLGADHTATDVVAVAVMFAGMGVLAWLLWRAMRAWSAERVSTVPMFEAA